MPNYAAPGGGAGQTIGTGNVSSIVDKLTQANRTMFDERPSAAYQYWMDSLGGLSTNDEQNLSSLMGKLFDRYYADTLTSKPGQGNYYESFVDYLAGQDPNRLVAGIPKQYRGEMSNRVYSGPLRWVPFA